MKEKFIEKVLARPRQVIVITVLLSLIMASGIFNIRTAARKSAAYVKREPVLTVLKNIVLFPI